MNEKIKSNEVSISDQLIGEIHADLNILFANDGNRVDSYLAGWFDCWRLNNPETKPNLWELHHQVAKKVAWTK